MLSIIIIILPYRAYKLRAGDIRSIIVSLELTTDTTYELITTRRKFISWKVMQVGYTSDRKGKFPCFHDVV